MNPFKLWNNTINAMQKRCYKMKRDNIPVKYSKEYGDESLPPLKDLVSDTPDSHKGIILDYLREHCVLARPGIVRDILDTEHSIGCGHIYSDGKFLWTDCFANYVDRYNIPVPKEFRNYILEHYHERKRSHLELRLTDHIVVRNYHLGCIYEIRVFKNGEIVYTNNRDGIIPDIFYLEKNDARYIIDPIMSELYCYDEDEHGHSMIDGYHWEIEFYSKKGLMKKIEGRPGESDWRKNEAKGIIKFIERMTQREMGSEYMDWE